MTIRMGYADTSGGQIHYRARAGAGTPAIFFHQTASSGKMWLRTFERLPGRPLHAFDTPGFGGSFDPERDSNPPMSQYVEWLAEAVRALDLGPVHVVSHHTGACIAVEMVLARGLVDAKSLTMVGPVPLTADERHEFSKHFGAPFTPTISGSYLLDNWDYLPKLGADADPLLFHREMADQLRAWWGRVQAYKAVWGQDFTGFLHRIDCPLLLLAGDTDVLHPFLARALEIRPDARTFALGGANFEPDLDPDTFADGLRAFLDEVDRA